MGVTSVRFNTNEERVLAYLKDHYHADASSVIKKALRELYEEARDRDVVEEFEVRESAGSVSFGPIDDLL